MAERKSRLGLLSACIVIAAIAPSTRGMSKPIDFSHYVMTVQAFPAAAPSWGLGAMLPVEMPYVPSFTIGDQRKVGVFASITQLAIGRCDPNCRYIEYGWYVSPTDYAGDNRPHMFIVLRGGKDFNERCVIDMKTCATPDGSCSCKQPQDAGGKIFEKAFFPLSGAEAYPGDPLDAPGSAFFYVGYYEGNHAWWIQYKDRWIGYIPDTGGYYPERFNGALVAQWFGETNTPHKWLLDPPQPELCTNLITTECACLFMGNGYKGTEARSARITNMLYLDSATRKIEPANAKLDKSTTTDEAVYSGGGYSWQGSPSTEAGPFDAFNYGGEGWNCSIAR